MKWKDKNVCVFGLGKSGRASIEWLHAKGANIFAADDNAENLEKLKSLDCYDTLKTGNIEHFTWDEMFALVLSPGVPFTHPVPHAVVELAHEHGLPIICDVELLWYAHPDASYVGITGTNGKSTTTALVGHILKEAGRDVAVGGNIGTPAAELAKEEHDIYVIELSSFQLDLLEKTKLNVAALLNITRDHIDRHGSMEHYVAVKETIFNLLDENGLAVVATDDQHTKAIYERLHARKTEVHGKDRLDWCTRRLAGEHNAQNIAVAYEVCRDLGLAEEVIKAGVKSFEGLRHRSQWVDERDGIAFVNDSKATNADATAHALHAYDNIYWIVGGREKEGGIDSLTSYFPKVKRAYLIGESMDHFAAQLDKYTDYKRCETLDRAVVEAFEDAKEEAEKATILLSPAAASFDQFANFEIRGDAFVTAVKELLYGAG